MIKQKEPFDYYKIYRSKLKFREAINLYIKLENEYPCQYALYHNWGNDYKEHKGRLIGQHSLVIEQQAFTLEEMDLDNWMVLELDQERNKKYEEIYYFANELLSEEDFDKYEIRSLDINQIFEVLSKNVFSEDLKIDIIKYLKSNIKININE